MSPERFGELNDLNRLIHRTTLDGAGMPLQAFANAHDAVGNVTRIEEAWLTSVVPPANSFSPLTQSKSPIANRIVNLGYDDAYRLTREEILPDGAPAEVSTYSYDNASNRTGMVRSGPKAATTVSLYNSLNQLIAFTETPWDGPVRQVSYSYDGAGSRITRTETGKEQAPDIYSYDREHRLTGLSQTRDATIQITVSPQQTGGVTLSPAAAAARAEATFSRRRDYAYAYDYRTRRVGRTEGGEASTVVFLGGLSVQEYGREANGARKAQPDVEHIRGSGMAGGVGGLVYSVRADAAPSYNLYNSRGDVVAQTNGTGAFTWQAAYEAFGTRTGESGLNRERHRANTKDEDPTGLLNEGMRYRDLETGVWLTRDPAGFVDGPNLYAYVRQNPWTAFDPHGLRTKAPNVRWRDVRGSTVTPDHPLVTKRSPNLDREKYGDGVYIDDNGYADFSPYARKLTPEGDTRIPFDPGQLKGNSHMDHDIGLARKKLKDQMGYTDELIAKLEKDHTWHHVEGGQRMELVPTDLHKAYFHFGGTSDIKRGNWFTGALCFVAGMFNPLSNTLEAAQSQGDVASALQSDVTDNFTPDMIAIPAAVGQAAADYAEKKVNTARRLNNYTNSQVPIERAMGQLSVQMYMLENDGEFPPGYRP